MYTLRNVAPSSERLNEKAKQSDSCRVQQLAGNSGLASELAMGTNYPAIYEYVAAFEDQNSLLELLLVVIFA